MRVTERAHSSARPCPNSDCHTSWALSPTRRSGNLGNNRCRHQRESQVGVRPPNALQRNADHQPLSVKELAFGLSSSAWKDVAWRQGSQRKLRSRFAAVRVRPAHRDYNQTEPYPEEWLLIEWPKKESEPSKYWLSTMPAKTPLKSLVKMAKHRWIVERDYEELKQELGLGHYEGRSWRGFHHHATLCIAAYGFLMAERNRFSPSARVGHVGLSAPQPPPDFRPRGSSRSPRAA
jgi:SRSO17 transposase